MPKGPRKFHFSFDASGLTRHGGLLLFQQFCKSFRLRHFLQRHVSWPNYFHRSYHPADLFLAHVFSIVTGIGRIANTQTLFHNGIIPPILGFSEFPHRDTLRTFLWRFRKTNLQSLESAHNKLRSELFNRLGLLYSAIIDADTTTMTVFGQQESTAVGYNRKYRGKRSYAPILSSEGRIGLSLGMELRSGNVHSSTGAWMFLKQQLDKLPSTIATSRTRFRLDGGFYDRTILCPLDDKKLGYVIVAKMTKPLKKKMVAAQFREFAQGWEVGHFPYPLTDWKKQHHFIAVRRPKIMEPADMKLRLFTFKNYTYHRVLVTENLDLMPEAIYRFYRNRAFQELLLREFKDSYHMAQIPTRSFWANAAYMETVLWAYDLVLAFQYLCLPPEIRHWNISTLRRELWWLPAEWVNRAGQNFIRLPKKYPQQDLFEKIQRATRKVKPLI